MSVCTGNGSRKQVRRWIIFEVRFWSYIIYHLSDNQYPKAGRWSKDKPAKGGCTVVKSFIDSGSRGYSGKRGTLVNPKY